jgi:uncharacterized membrane protein
MNSTTLLLALRLIHILAGIFWVGGVAVVAAFVLPSSRALGPGGGPMMNQLAQVRKLPLRLLIAGWVTVLSGVALYMRASSLAGGPPWYNSAPGRVFGFGGLVGIVVVLMGTFANLPTARRMNAIATQMQAGGATPELSTEMQRLQGRLKRLTEIAAGLLLLAAAAMAVARYWPS